MSRGLRGFAAFLVLAVITGCAGPAPAPPTVVKLTLTATTDANAGASGQGAPVEVRVYQLAATSAFDNADFFQLFNHDAATLGGDLVHTDKFLLVPGKSRTVVLTPEPRVTALGFFGAYSAYGSATWRAKTPVPAHKVTLVTLTAGRAALAVKAVPAPGS
ncbi:MAG: type VI secretion system lipoprotein TssJ [Rhodospirillales bacterium]|nr:type VI secretion system lipoprotein TssJ [Rhodospirillales bacterium]